MEAPTSEKLETVEHPAAVMQRSYFNDEEAKRLKQMRLTMGWAPAAHRALTMQLIGSTGRMGGLPSSRASLRHYAGANSKFDFEDFLGLPMNNPNLQPAPRAFFEREFDGAPLRLPTGQHAPLK